MQFSTIHSNSFIEKKNSTIKLPYLFLLFLSIICLSPIYSQKLFAQSYDNEKVVEKEKNSHLSDYQEKQESGTIDYRNGKNINFNDVNTFNFATSIQPKLDQVLINNYELCRTALTNNSSLEEKLSFCPMIARLIKWQNADGTYVGYNSWSSKQKSQLQNFYEMYLSNASSLGLSCEAPSSTSIPSTYFHTTDAFNIFAAQVAHVFYLEKSRLVPWSILNLAPAELAVLLNSNTIFSPIIDRSSLGTMPRLPMGIRPGNDYQLQDPYTNTLAPCDPRVAYRFLNGSNNNFGRSLIGNSTESTLAMLTLWGAKNFKHVNTNITDRPVIYSIEDNLHPVEITEDGITSQRILVEGCRGAANLFLTLTRSINLPLIAVRMNPNTPEASQTNYSQHYRLPQSSYKEFSHLGLAFHWTGNAKIIEHMDDLHSVGDAPNWIVDPLNGVLSTAEELAQPFFDVYWHSFQELEAINFNPFRSFPKISEVPSMRQFLISGAGFIESSDLSLSYLGNFNATFATRMYENSNSIIHARFIRKYELCAWREFLSYYCEERDIFEPQMISSTRFNDRGATPLPSPAQFAERAEYCLSIIGSCDQARSQQQFWYEVGLGNLHWQD